MSRITIELTEEQKRKLKVLAAISSMTIKDLIIDRTIGSEPNEETLQSFADYQNKSGLTKHENFEEFWKEINNDKN